MMNCRSAKRLIMESTRGSASPEARASIDTHIADCADCRKEQAHWLLLERIGRLAPPGLSADSQRQMLQRLIRQAQTQARPAGVPKQTLFWPAILSAASAVAVVVLLFWRFDWAHRDISGQNHSPVASVAARVDGTIQMSGAQVSYLAGTALRIDDSHREVILEKGEVDVDVSHAVRGSSSRFRVLTARFVVEVWGTRFRVTEESVVTLRGHVKVLSLDGKELATLHAGQRWQLPEVASTATLIPQVSTGPSVQPANAAPLPIQTAVATSPKAGPIGEGNRATALSVRQKLALARTALADGNIALARQRIADALKSDPSLPQRATLALLEADCLLSERRYGEAIAAYRTVAISHPDDPSGETASFALAQLLSERGTKEEARAALDAYLERYPSGRFVREVQEKIQRASDPK